MTACIYHGPPGSYKTFSLIQDVVVPALISGRSVVTNIRGLDDIDRIESALGVTIPDAAELITISHDKQGFDDMARFFHWAPEGALIVMDEGQRVYPSRLRNLSQFDNHTQQPGEEGRPITVEDAFDKHRHYNWDIYLSTPFIGKIHNEVRQVCEYAYKHRNVSGFLPWWKNRYRQTKHEPLNNGTSASHAIGDPKGRKADVRIFGTYQSTKTGVANDSNENKSIFRQKKIYFYFAVIVVAVIFLARSINSISSRSDTPTDLLVASQTGEARLIFPDSDADISTGPVSPDRYTPIANQFFAYDGHYKGSIYWDTKNTDKPNYIHTFTFIDPITERTFDVTSRDLEAIGFEITAFNCLASLTLGNRSKLITCLSPDDHRQQNSPVQPVERSNASEPATQGKRVVYLHDSDQTEPQTSSTRLLDPNVTRSNLHNRF